MNGPGVLGLASANWAVDLGWGIAAVLLLLNVFAPRITHEQPAVETHGRTHERPVAAADTDRSGRDAGTDHDRHAHAPIHRDHRTGDGVGTGTGRAATHDHDRDLDRDGNLDRDGAVDHDGTRDHDGTVDHDGGAHRHGTLGRDGTGDRVAEPHRPDTSPTGTDPAGPEPTGGASRLD